MRREVEAVEDRLGVTRRVQMVDLGAVAARGEGEGECRAQVAQGDVQLAAQLGEFVDPAQPSFGLRAGRGVLEGLCIVPGVAGFGEVAADAVLPEPFVRHTVGHPLKERLAVLRGAVAVAGPGGHVSCVEIYDGDGLSGVPAGESQVDELGEAGVAVVAMAEEIDQSALVDGDQPGLPLSVLPFRFGGAGEGCEELLQDLVPVGVPLVLAAVVVGAETVALQGEVATVRPHRAEVGAPFAGLALEALQEGGLAVARIAGDHDERVASLTESRDKLTVQGSLDVHRHAVGVEAAGAAVAAAALAVQRLEVRDERVAVRLGVRGFVTAVAGRWGRGQLGVLGQWQ